MQILTPQCILKFRFHLLSQPSKINYAHFELNNWKDFKTNHLLRIIYLLWCRLLADGPYVEMHTILVHNVVTNVSGEIEPCRVIDSGFKEFKALRMTNCLDEKTEEKKESFNHN